MVKFEITFLCCRKERLGKNGNKYKADRGYICRNCLGRYKTEFNLLKHEDLCYDNDPRRLVAEKEGTFKEFTKFQNTIPASIYCVLDFESNMRVPEEEKSVHPGQPDSYTVKLSKHVCSAFSFCMIDAIKGEVMFERTDISDTNILDSFYQTILEADSIIRRLINNPKKIHMTEAEKLAHSTATRCHMCKGDLSMDPEGYVANHCHLSGRYLGAAHGTCNRSFRRNGPITPVKVFSHNFRLVIFKKLCFKIYNCFSLSFV